MISETLRHADAPLHRSEPGYSRFVAGELVATLADLDRPASSPSTFVRQLTHLELIEHAKMSIRQRLLTYYAFGKTWRGLGDEISGIEYLDRALDIAEHLNDKPAMVDLLYLVGGAERARSQYGAASKFLSTGLDTLHELRARGGSGMCEDSGQELRAHILLAVCCGMVEDFPAALMHIDKASRFAPQTGDLTLHAATIDWLRANVLCAMGNPTAALPLAKRATAVYATASSTSGRESYARLQIVVAETAMDIAEDLTIDPPAEGREGMLALAYPYVERGMQLANGSLDPTGAVLAVLAQVRFDRLSSGRGEGIWTLEKALQRATVLRDPPLLAQTYTAFGDELDARDEQEAGLDMYRRTLDVVRRSAMPMHGARAKRMLLQAFRGTLQP